MVKKLLFLYITDLNDHNKGSVSLIIESGNKKSLFYKCPHCDIEVCMQEADEIKFRKTYNDMLSNYVRKYAPKDKDGVVNEFLCYCPYCLLSSSALSIFQDDF